MYTLSVCGVVSHSAKCVICFINRAHTDCPYAQISQFWDCHIKKQDSWSPYPSIWMLLCLSERYTYTGHNRYSKKNSSCMVKWSMLRKACLFNSAQDMTARWKMKYTSALRIKSLGCYGIKIVHLSSWPLEPPHLKVFLIFFQHVVALKTAAVTQALQYLRQPNLTKKNNNTYLWIVTSLSL